MTRSRSRESRDVRRWARGSSATSCRRSSRSCCQIRTSSATTAAARDAYDTRRTALIDALAEHGVAAHGRSGLNVWIPVREEAPIVRAMLDAGWLVLAGERFRIATPPGIRVTTSTLAPSDAAGLARLIAAAEHAGRPRRVY